MVSQTGIEPLPRSRRRITPEMSPRVCLTTRLLCIRVGDLMNVKGIGEKSFLKLKPLVTVTTDRAAAAQK
jgi:hypothetical protein